MYHHSSSPTQQSGTSRYHNIKRYQETEMANGTKRVDIKVGQRVSIVLKQDQRSGRLTEGIIRDILTKSANHSHGIKVRLENGLVGRVKVINSLE